MVHADFEACTKPISDCEPISDGSFTKKHQKHKPCGFCYHIVCFSDKLYSQGPVIYRENSEDEDVAQTFVEMPEKNIKNIHKEFDFAMKMIFDQEERLKFRAEVFCWIYKGSFDNNREVSWSNSSHLFLKNLGKSEGNIKCIPDNEEKYIRFTEDVVVANLEIKKVKKLKSRVSFALSTASSSWLLSLKNIVSNSAARPKAWVAKRSLTRRACLLGACLFETCQSCLVNYNEMERELSRIHYSPQGFWRGLPAVKKLAQEAGVSDDNAEIWLMRRAIWQIYMLETNF